VVDNTLKNIQKLNYPRSADGCKEDSLAVQ
jgi:hypothetical protein